MTKKDYKKSVQKLLELSRDEGSASELAAKILLSTQNGRVCTVALDAFCNLDKENFGHAINCISFRYFEFQEPFDLLEEDTNKIFNELKKIARVV